MFSEVLTNHEIIFAICAFIFSFGGFYAIQKRLPEILRKSMDRVDLKMDRLDSRMDATDKSVQNVQISQAINNEKVNSLQAAQVDLRQSILELTKVLNSSIKGN